MGKRMILAAAALLLSVGLAASPAAAAQFRPDLFWDLGDGVTKGDDVYNRTGEHQTLKVKVHRGSVKSRTLAFQNDGKENDFIDAKANSVSGKVQVTYENGVGFDITLAVVAGTQNFGIPPGIAEPVEVHVSVAPDANVGAKRTVRVKSTSEGNPDKVDVVKLKIKVV
jgi:hypothetical protein